MSKKSVLLSSFFGKGILLISLFSSIQQLSAQEVKRIMESVSYNFSSFTTRPVYSNMEKLYAVNKGEDISNPDFGKIAPGIKPEWYEQYSKRTATTRSFITEDGAVVSGTSYTPVNYLDKNGKYRAIDARLLPAASGWSAMEQEFPTFLNIDGSTEITLSANDRLKFNINSSVAGNSIAMNTYTVGDNGMMIQNAVVGIDKKIIFKENSIETDYVLNKPLSNLSTDLVITEEIILPPGYTIREKNLDELFGAGSNRFEMVVINASGVECAHFKMPVCYEAKINLLNRSESFCYGKYALRTSGNKTLLDIVVPAAWLNDPARSYPITIDPVVTGPTTTWAGGLISSCVSPTFNTATINVNVPANITITNFYVSSSYYADPLTFTVKSDGLMYFTTLCGRDPSSTSLYWTVQPPGGNFAGDAYLTLQDMGSTEAFCLSPSCSAQNLALTMNLARTYGAGGCNANYIYHNPASGYPFQAYIVGRSVELTGGTNSWTVSPTTLCSNSCSFTVNATVSGGVPPFTMTHPWSVSSTTFGSHVANTSTSSGSGSLTLTNPACPSTCGSASLSIPAPVIIDACGNSVGSLSAKTVTQNPQPVVTPSPSSTTICTGQTVTITNTSCVGGSTITWTGSNGSSGTGNIVNAPVNGSGSPIVVNYTVNVSANGCAGAAVVVPVTVNPTPVISVSPSAPLICIGQSVSLTASGATTYSWSPSGGLSATSGSTVTANPGTTTVYTVTGSTGGSCTAVGTVTVTLRTPPTIAVNPPSATICNGQSVSLTASGASTYSWSPNAALNVATGATVIASPPSTYIYTVTGTDVNGCSGSTNVTVNVNAAPAISVSPSAPAYCSGGSVSLTASGGTSYSWSPSGGLSGTSGSTVTANPGATSTYVVTGTNAGGCTNTSSVTVTVNQPPTITVNPSSPSVCGGQAVFITASGANTYTWSPGSGLSSTTGATVSANPSSTTTYTITGTDAKGCTNTRTVTVSVNTPPTITINPTSASICNGQSVTLSAGGGNTYAWGPSSGLSATTGTSVSASPMSTTTYTVTGTAANGCSSTATVVVTINTSFSVNAGSDASICPGASAQISVNGAPNGSTYTWSPSTNLSCTNCFNPVADPTATTTYIVTATSPAGCNAKDTVTVVVTPLTVTADPVPDSVCTGSFVQLNAYGATGYSWSPITNLTDPNVSNPVSIPLATITYTVTGTTGNCSGTATVTVTTFPTLPTPTINQAGNVLTCTTAPQYVSYQWYFNATPINGATTNVYTATVSGNYNVVVKDANDCSISVGINIIVESVNEFTASGKSLSVYPNPANDLLMVKASIPENETVVVTISDLLGKAVQTEKRNWSKQALIAIEQLAPGIYFLQVQEPKGNWIGRFVKE